MILRRLECAGTLLATAALHEINQAVIVATLLIETL